MNKFVGKFWGVKNRLLLKFVSLEKDYSKK